MAFNSPGGKGSAARPMSVDKKTFEDNFDRIFGKKDNRNKELFVEKFLDTENLQEPQELVKQISPTINCAFNRGQLGYAD